MTTATTRPKTSTAPRGLSSITVGGGAQPPRTLIYGVDGIGKSTFAAGMPAPVLIPTEDGATRIDVPQSPLCETWADVLESLRSLCREKHEFRTVVLDSADWAQALAIQHLVATAYEGDMQAFDAYGRGYKLLMQEWQKLLAALDYVRRQVGMEVVLIAHAVVRTFRNPGGDDYDRYQSNLIDTPNTSIWAKTKEWADLVLFANYEVMVRKESAKAAKGKAVMARGDNARVLHAAPSAAWDAKVRAGWTLKDKFPLDAAQFRAMLDGQAAAEDEANEQEAM